jgi:hypothetical protein
MQFKNMADKGASSAKISQSVNIFEIFGFHAIIVGLVKIEGQGQCPEA